METKKTLSPNINKVNIRTSSAKMDVKTATSITNKDALQHEIISTTTADELIKPAIILAKIKKQYDDADKAFKAAVKLEADKSKAIKTDIANIEKSLKENALRVMKIDTIQKINKETGEITKKIVHDLETKLFSYTKGSKTAIIDTKTILENPDDYKKFLKPVTTYEIDFNAINEAPSDELPWIENKTASKISFKKISDTDAKLLLERLKDATVQKD